MFDSVPAVGGNIVKRQLQFFWLADHSGSMGGAKIASLNQAIREVVPEIKAAVAMHPEVQIQMRAIKFADTADWHVGPTSVELGSFHWPELSAIGATATAEAIRLLTTELELEKMGFRGYPPVCILLSDGHCTDREHEYEEAIRALKAQPWGMKAVRLAIAMGDESDYDEDELLKFVSHPEIGVLKAHNPEQLVAYIQWASISATVGASVGKSKIDNIGDPSAATTNVVLANPPQLTSAGGVF